MEYKKKYQEALEKVKGLLKDQEIALHAREKLANVFPELKESEDDKTRKEILNVFKQLDEGTTICGRNYDYAKWIAWLEKQGTQKPSGSGKVEPEFKEGDWVIINETVYQITEIDDSHVVLSFNGRECEFGLEVLNNAKNFESRFKVGDWITNGRYVRLVVGVDSRHYQFKDGDAKSIDDIDKKYHLWTINDAKDGDVLFHSDSASNGIFIFKEILQRGTIQEVVCYCDYDSEDGFCLGEKHTCCWTDSKILHPATKEQRDLLFSKMKLEGYEWDADKKN